MDTFPSPYYDILVGNSFKEFIDLLFSVGRIEDRIRKGRIKDTRASILEKKEIVLMSMFKQYPWKGETRESFV